MNVIFNVNEECRTTRDETSTYGNFRDLDFTGRMLPCWILTMKTMKRSWKRGWTCPIEECMGCLKRLSIVSFHLFKLGLCWISYIVWKWMKTWWKRKTSFFLTWNGHFIQIFQRQEKEEKEAEAKKESQGKKKKKALWHSNQYQLCVRLWVGKNLLFQHENFRICSILQEVVQENAEMPPVPPSTVAGRQ